MADTKHPSDAQLVQFAKGQLDDALFEQIASHVEHCNPCARKLDVDSIGLGETPILGEIAEGPGTVIGPYKLLQQIGEGGMGIVYLAEQHEPVRRQVALKLIKPGMDSRQVLARFEAEQQALALMDHHNIAKVFDAGISATGRSYFVMELVKGVPITIYCDEHRLTPVQRLELFRPVCQAVQHAHQKGIIHRDIKPSNILVCLYEGKPMPKVIDFGIAKATNQRLTDQTMFTEFGQVLGTLEYMSPEQAVVNQLDIDTRSDIYSLGVVLYELLTGTTPISRSQLQHAGFEQMFHLIREVDPPKPSTRISESRHAWPSISSRRNTDPAQLVRWLRGDLDLIVMKALDKDRTRRYETAYELASDISRYLLDLPVEASPPSARYRFRKFARRNKSLLMFSSLIAVTLILSTLSSAYMAIKAHRAELLASKEKGEVQRVNMELTAALYESLLNGIRAESAAKQPGYREKVRRMARQVIPLCDDEQLEEIKQAFVNATGEPLGWGPKRLIVNDRVSASALDPLSHRIAVALASGRLQVIDFRINRTIMTYNSPELADDDFFRAIGYRDSNLLAVDGQGRVFEWERDSTTPALRTQLNTDGVISFGRFSDDCEYLVLNKVYWVELWRVDSGELMGRFEPPWEEVRTDASAVAAKIMSVRLSPNGEYIAAGYYGANPDRTGFFVWDRDQHVVHSQDGLRATSFNGIGFSADSQSLIFGSAEIAQYDVSTWQKSVTTRPTDEVHAVCYSPCGRYFAVYYAGGRIEVRRVASGQLYASFSEAEEAGNGGIPDLHFSDRDMTVVAVRANTLTMWNVDDIPERQYFAGHSRAAQGLAFAHHDDLIATCGSDGIVTVSDSTSGKLIRRFNCSGEVGCIAFSPDDRILAAGVWGSKSCLQMWSTVDWSSSCMEHDLGDICGLAFNPQGKSLAATGSGLQIWDLTFSTGERLPTLEKRDSISGSRSLTLAVSSTSQHLAWVDQDTNVWLGSWDEPQDRNLGLVMSQGGWHALCFLPNDQLVYSGDDRLQIYDIHGKTDVNPGLTMPLTSSPIAAHPNGRFVAGISHSAVVIWDLTLKRRILELPPHTSAEVYVLAWHPFNNHLCVGTSDGNVSIWRIDSLLSELASLGLSRS